MAGHRKKGSSLLVVPKGSGGEIAMLSEVVARFGSLQKEGKIKLSGALAAQRGDLLEVKGEKDHVHGVGNAQKEVQDEKTGAAGDVAALAPADAAADDDDMRVAHCDGDAAAAPEARDDGNER